MVEKNRKIWSSIQDKLGSVLFGQHLSLSSIGWGVVTLVSVSAAVILYFVLQQQLQKNLATVVQKVDVMRAVCAQIPAIYQEDCLNSTGRSDRLGTELTWHIFADAGIVDRKRIPSVVEYENELSNDKALEYLNKNFDDGLRFREFGPDLLIKVSRLLCEPGGSVGSDDTGGVDTFRNRITHLVAQLQPHEYQTAYQAADQPIKLSKFRLSVPRGVTDSEIVEWMFRLSGSTSADSDGYGWGDSLCEHRKKIHSDLPSGTIVLAPTDQWKVLAGSEKLALWFIGQIRSTPEYRDARFLLTVFTGPEQFAIFLVGFFAMILTIFRLITASRMQEISDEILKRRSKKPPRGNWELLNLLQKVGERVAAQSPSERGYWKDQLMDEISSARWPTRLAICLLYTSPSPRDQRGSRMPSSA